MKQLPIMLSEPFPLLDPGDYVARCSEATYAWARQWSKWRGRLVLEPTNYTGRPYTGRLCKFLGLGADKQRPYAGPQSEFRRLLVEVNGEQPTRSDTDMDLFVGVTYAITVETVTTDRNGKPRQPEHWYSIVRDIHPVRSCAPPAPPRTFQPINPQPINSSTTETQTTHSTDQHSNTVNTPRAKQSAPKYGMSIFERRRRNCE